jgi:predicted Rossmann fold nucleotide-binding protein DprA/Smf involved in DNA uptake
LLRDGAVPILAADDLLLALGVEPRPVTPKSSGASGAAGKLLAALDAGPREVDALGRELSLTPAELSASLLELELAGLARREGSRVLRGAR